MAKLSNKQLAIALYEATKDAKPKELGVIGKNFAELLMKKQKLKQADSILKIFEEYSKQQAGIKDIEIHSARELNNEMVEKIKKYFGKEVNAVLKIDKEMIGGIKVKYEDLILDGSIKTQLKQLKNQLSK